MNSYNQTIRDLLLDVSIFTGQLNKHEFVKKDFKDACIQQSCLQLISHVSSEPGATSRLCTRHFPSPLWQSAFCLNEMAVWEVTSLAFYREKNTSTGKTHLYFLCLLSRKNASTPCFFIRKVEVTFYTGGNGRNGHLNTCAFCKIRRNYMLRLFAASTSKDRQYWFNNEHDASPRMIICTSWRKDPTHIRHAELRHGRLPFVPSAPLKINSFS